MKRISPAAAPRLRALAVPAAQLLLPFLFSAAILSGGYAPFALALVSAAGPGLPGLFCLAGTGVGSLVFLDFQWGLRHFAAAVLIFAANIALYDTRLYRRPLFKPLSSAGWMVLVQSVYLLDRGAEQWAACAASAACLAAASWRWRELWTHPRPADAALGLAALAAAAAPVMLLQGVSLGRLLAAALSLLAALRLPLPEAAASAAAVGLLTDLASGGAPLFAAVYGCAAAAAALFRDQRPPAALAFALAGGVAGLLFRAEFPAAAFAECLAAAALLAPLRRRARPAQLQSPPEGTAPSSPTPVQQSASALRALYDSFFRSASPPAPENPSVLFDQTAERVCRNCVLCASCWHQNYTGTYNAFNDACPRLLQRGRAEAGDFPLYFSSRCVHFTDFLAVLNEELRTYLTRRQYRQRILEVRRQAQDQYRQLGEALASASVHAVANVTAPMGYQIGSSLRPRDGESLCGDQLASFEVGSTLYLLLSDGMGSGEAAHREAAMTVRLLRQFLQAGIDPGPALRTLNSALHLRGEEGGGCTTIDLLALQRDTGAAAVYKYGAAPSYVKYTGSVTRITGRSLPAGLQSDPPEVTRMTLRAGSCFVMISDGIADETCDEWLQNLLAGWQGREVNALIARIMAESRSRKGLTDDCAVLAVQLPGGTPGGKKSV